MSLFLHKYARSFQRVTFVAKPLRIVNKNNVTVVQIQTYCSNTNEKNRWNTWRSIVKGFVPVGLCLIGVMQWRAYRKYASTHIAKQWEVDFYCALPLRMLSRSWGWIADKRLPEFMRPWIYGLYASSFDVDISEAVSTDFKYYPSLADFFARPLKEGARKIDTDSSLTSPCDGKVLHFGPVNSSYVEQVKGVTYSLKNFLEGKADNKTKDKFSDYRTSLLIQPENKPTTLYQCVIYLAPGDYHRFHSPTDWQPTIRKHFSGELLSVNPAIARWIPGLFTLNERAVYMGRWKHGFFSFTAVGATNVGSVKVYFDKGLQTNIKGSSKCDDVCFMPNIELNKGDIIGEFRMGSTVVLIFEAPLNFEFNLSAGQSVRMGQGIGTIRKLKYVDSLQKPNYNVNVS